MNIQPLPISPQLKPYIAEAIYIKRDSDYTGNFKLVPRLYSVFFFTLDYVGTAIQNINNVEDRKVQSCNIYFGGLGYVPLDFELPPKMELILVMPKPHCTALFWKEDANYFANTMYQVSDAGKHLRILNEKVNNAYSLAEKWLHIQQYLEKQVEKCPSNLNYATKAIELMFRKSGSIGMETLANETYTCDRNLRDIFQQHIGFSPKKFASIVKFNALVHQHLTQPLAKTLTELATDFNYYDLSHLNKDFMRFTGINAESFFKQEQGINRLIMK